MEKSQLKRGNRLYICWNKSRITPRGIDGKIRVWDKKKGIMKTHRVPPVPKLVSSFFCKSLGRAQEIVDFSIKANIVEAFYIDSQRQIQNVKL